MGEQRPKHSQFKPGQSGNPSGRPKGLLTADQVSALISRLAVLTLDELKLIQQDPKAEMHRRIIATEIVTALEKADYGRLEALFMRGIGKVRDVTEVHQHNYDAELDGEPKENVLKLLREMRGPQKTGT